MIVKAVIVCVVIVCLENLAEVAYRKTDRYRSTLGGADRFIKNVPSNLEIVNIGSGPGLYAISYDKCWKKGFNFSTAPQNYNYGFRLLKRFKDNLCANCIIIIIIMSPLSFGENADYQRKDYADKFYGILNKNDIDNYSAKRALCLRHPLLMRVMAKVKRKLSNAVKGSGGNVANISNEPPLIQTWKREFDLSDLMDSSQAEKHRRAFGEKIKILTDGINFCREQSWRPVLVIPPVPEKTRAYISKEFLEAFVYENLDKVIDESKDIGLLNYYDNCEFTKDMFSDDIFMNNSGREYFSEMLFKDIQRIMND